MTSPGTPEATEAGKRPEETPLLRPQKEPALLTPDLGLWPPDYETVKPAVYFGEIPTEPGDQDETLRGPGPAPSHMGETEGQSREEATQRAGPHHLPGEGSALPRPQFTVCEVGFGRHVCVKDQGDHGWGAAPPPISGPAAADPHSTQSLGGGGLAALGWRTCRSPGRSRPQPPGPAVLVGLEGVDVVQGAAVPGVPSGGCEVNGHLQGPQCEDPGTPPSWAGVGTCTPL